MMVEQQFRLVSALLDGRAALFARFALASTAFVLLALLARRLPPALRLRAESAASLVILAAVSTPLLAAVMAVYALALFAVVEWLSPGRVRTGGVLALLVLHVVGPVVWFPHLPGYVGSVREFVAFATNLTLLRCWGYAYDRLRRPDPIPPTLGEYAHYMFFFPAFLNGPLLSLGEFRRRRAAGPGQLVAGQAGLTGTAWRSLLRIARGAAAVLLAMFVVCSAGTSGYEAAVRGRPPDAWFHVARVYVCLYLSFWGWTEAAIGFGAFGGVILPENFDNPSLAYGTADFWRRWNMTFNRWLRQYVYLPLGGAWVRGRDGVRRLEWRNTAVVFGVVAGYHLYGGLKLLGTGYFQLGSYVPWTLWAALNTVAVLATRQLTRPPRLGAAAVSVIVVTFLVSSVGLMTAVFPPTMAIAQLGVIYRRLFIVPG